MTWDNKQEVLKYAKDCASRKKVACPELGMTCKRFLSDLGRKDLDFNPKDAEFVIRIIEKTIVHKKGEAPDGTSLTGKPFKLESWQKFIVYNLQQSAAIKKPLSLFREKTGKHLSLLRLPGVWRYCKEKAVLPFISLVQRFGKQCRVSSF